MSTDVGRDQLVLIRIDGMHCHRCEKSIQKALLQNSGVHEVEVDFPSGQASVLYDPASVTIAQLTESVTSAGYHVSGFSQRQTNPAAS